MTTKKQSKEFVDKLSLSVLEMGAVRVKDDIFPNRFSIDTIAGKMSINIDADSKYCFTVYCKFEDVNAAKQKFDCNPFSGKFNSHIGATKELTVDKAVELSLIHIERTQP
jgi:hypothetical protein